MNIKAIFQNKKTIFLLIFLFFFGVAAFLIAGRINEVIKFGARAAPYEAIFYLSPENVSLNKGKMIAVEVWLDPVAGGTPADIQAVEFKLLFDPSKINIVDQNGDSSVSEITLASDMGDVFYGLTEGLPGVGNYYVVDNSVNNSTGEIHFSVSMHGDVRYSGTMAKTTSFYIKALANSGIEPNALIFSPVTWGAGDDEMHALQYTGDRTNTPDILSGEMNGDSSSRLEINFGGAGVPTLSLTTPNTNLNVGDTFNVTIEANTAGKDTIGIDAYLQYDSNKISITNIFPGSIFPQGNYQGLNIPSEGGIVAFEISSFIIPNGDPAYNSDTNPENVFATIQFKAIDGPTTDLQFIFDGFQKSTTDSNILKWYDPGVPITESDDILEKVNNLSLNIVTASPSPSVIPSVSPSPSVIPSVSPSPSPTSTPSPSLSPTPSPDLCIISPVNMTCNEDPLTVDSTDLSIIVAGWGTTFTSLPSTCNGCSRDPNGDGKINAADIQIFVSWWGWGIDW